MSVAVDLFWDAENSTNGTTMTTAIMDAGTHLSSALGAWTFPATNNFYTVSTSAQKGHGARSFTVSGTPFTDSAGTRGMRQDHTGPSGGNAGYYSWVKSAATAKWSASIWFQTGVAYQGFESYSLFGLQDGGFAGGAFFNLQTFGASSHETYIENVDSATLQGPSLSKDTWYLLCLLYDQANNLGKLSIYDTAYTQVGSTVQLALGTAPANCNQALVGSFGGNFPDHPVATIWDDLAVDPTGTTFPLLPTASGSIPYLMMLGVG